MTSPARKRARRKTANEGGKWKTRESYFDLLSEEGIENVFRYLSYEPRLVSWVDSVSPTDVLTLYQCKGVLSKFARRIFCKLDTSTIPFPPEPRGGYSDLIGPGRILLQQLISEAASSITDFRINNRVPFSRLATSFPTLKILSVFNCPFRLSFNKAMLQSRHLHTLELRGVTLRQNDIWSIAFQCTMLRRLRIHWTNANADQKGLLRTLFEGISCGLEELHLINADGIITYIPDVLGHCKNLRTIGFEQCQIDRHEASYASACTQFRDRLKLLRLTDCPVPKMFLISVRNLCDHVVICGSAVRSSLELLSTIGPAAGEVALSRRSTTGTDEEKLKLVASTCLNIAKLHIWNHRESHVLDFLVHSHPVLRDVSIEISQVEGLYKGSDIFEALAKKQTVQVLNFVGPMPSEDSFGQFVRGNQQLQNLRIKRTDNHDVIIRRIIRTCSCRSFKDQGTASAWAVFVKILTKAPELQILSLSCNLESRHTLDFLEFHDMCNVFRTRRFFSANIWGRSYLA